MIENKEIARGVGQIPSGLFVICTKDGDQKDGYLASWVQQISFDPLIISIACKEGRPGYEHIMSGKPFSVNIVGKHNMDYMKHFWSGYDPKENPFGSIDHEVTANDTILLKDAKSCIECKMVSKAAPGDHEIVFAEVINSRVINEDAEVKVHLRKSGLDY